MSQYLDKRLTEVPAIRYFSRRCKLQFFSQDHRNVGPTPVAYRSKGTEAEKLNEVTEPPNWSCGAHLVQHSATEDIKWTVSRFVKIQRNLGVDSDTKIVVHLQFAMRQPIHVQSTTSTTFDVNEPTIQMNDLSILNLTASSNSSYRVKSMEVV